MLDTSKQSLQSFYNWWSTGLSYLLPDSLHQKFHVQRDQFLIEVDDRRFIFNHTTAETTNHKEWTLDRSNMLEKADLKQRLHQHLKPDTLITVILPEDKVLKKPLVLPIAAISNLREILGFEMDKQTPFQTDQVYYDWKITEKNTDQQKLHVELIVLPKSVLDSILNDLRELQIRPHAVTINPYFPAFNINLLPMERRLSLNNRTTRFTYLIALLSTILLLAILYAPLLRHENILDEMGQQVSALRVQAKAAQSLIQEKEDILARSQFLNEKRREQIPMIDIVRELTTILPDNTLVNRIMIRDKKLQLYGESDTATAIIQLLEGSKLFSKAQFQAPVTKNTATQKDRFQVAAEIMAPNNT